MGVHGVLDGELVEPEDVRDARDLLLGRLVQPDPHEPLAAAADLGQRAVVGEAAGEAHAVDVDGAVDDVGRQWDVELGQHRRPGARAGVRGAQSGTERRQRRHGTSRIGRAESGAADDDAPKRAGKPPRPATVGISRPAAPRGQGRGRYCNRVLDAPRHLLRCGPDHDLISGSRI